MQRPYFHKLVLSSTIQERRLRIPESFLKKFGHELTAFARLIVPDGRIWQVGLRKIDNKVWFHDGWLDFMNFFSIQIGYFLVFRYDGSSSFKVNIFNLASSEISYQTGNLGSAGKLNGKLCHIFEEMEDNDSDEFLGISPSSAAMKNKVLSESADKLGLSKNFSPPALQNLFNGSNFPNCVSRDAGHNMNTPVRATKDTGVLVSASELKTSAEQAKMLVPGNESGSVTKPKRKRQSSSANKQGTSTPRDEEAEARYRFYESASARKRTVTAEERERALNAAKMFEPANPFCRVVLRPSYLYRGCIMYLPSCFAEKNLNGVSGFIKLQLPNGKQWPVRCLYKGGRAKLSQGWYDFCLENHLEEGDVCIFELLRAKEVILQITIFRVIENHGPLNQPFQQNVYQTKVIKK